MKSQKKKLILHREIFKLCIYEVFCRGFCTDVLLFLPRIKR